MNTNTYSKSRLTCYLDNHGYENQSRRISQIIFWQRQRQSFWTQCFSLVSLASTMKVARGEFTCLVTPSLSLSFIGFPTTADSISPSATPCFPPDTLRKGRNGLFQGRPAIRSPRNGAKDQAAWNFRLFNSRNSENIFHSLCTMLSVVD